MNVEELKKWAIEHIIEERTKASFYKMLNNYKIDNPEEYVEILGNICINELSLQIHMVSLNLGNWPECSYNTISASMRIKYNGKQIANYKTLYTLDGEDEDDFFDIL